MAARREILQNFYILPVDPETRQSLTKELDFCTMRVNSIGFVSREQKQSCQARFTKVLLNAMSLGGMAEAVSEMKTIG